jgi:hypothetical protein
MSDASKWEITDNKELLEYIKEFKRIITAKVYNQIEILEITQMKPYESVWEWINNKAAAFKDVTKTEHRSLL